jgi:hypothetical protein
LLGIVNAPGFNSRSGTGESVTAAPATSGQTTTPTTSGCNGQILCDGFEDAANGIPNPADWTISAPNCSGSGTIAIDTAVAHSGNQSLRIDGQGGYCNHVFIANSAVSSLGPVVYGRYYLKMNKALSANHVTFQTMKDNGDSGKDLRMGGQSQIFMWNRESDDATLPELGPIGIAMSVQPPANAWTCVEFSIDQSQGHLQTWIDGSAVTSLQVDGIPTPEFDRAWLQRGTWSPALADFKLGWESYGSDANTLWFDDVVLDSKRIGCNP